MNQKQLKDLIREEYHNVKDFMEEKYGFTPELGKVIDNPYVSAFKAEDYLNEESELAYLLRRMADVGGDEAEEFLSNNKVSLYKIKLALRNNDFTKYDLRDVIQGKAARSIKKKVMRHIKESMNEGGDDSEMAVSQLNRSLDYAKMLIDKLRGKGDLEPWVQSYITKAEDYLNTTFDYYKGKEGEIQEYDVETIEETKDFINFMKEQNDDIYALNPTLHEAEYQGRDVKLNKIMQGDVKKFKVYVKNPKGNVVKVNFGHGGSSAKGKTMKIKKSNPERRKSFRARHNCDNPGPRHKARYWACRTW